VFRSKRDMICSLMSSQVTQTTPSPERLFQALNAYQLTNCLRGAIELDLFTAIAEGNNTSAAIASRIGASERGTRILCDYLTVAGFIEKSSGRYRLVPDAALFLDRRSSAYLGTTTRFLAMPQLQGYFDDIAAIVRKGGTLSAQHGTVEPDNPLWVEFARSMSPLMELPSQMMAEILVPALPESARVLDIAAGHGLFGIAIAQKHPTAQITALDWTKVLAVALENAKARGVGGRIQALPGSAFGTDFGSSYDLVLLTNFLHHFDPATCESLLRKVRASLKPRGRVATLEFVPNSDRVSPPAAATFSLMMLGTTDAGDAYTFQEFEGMFRNAGFQRSEAHGLTPSPETLIVSYA
jgi:2-polyprenyl-3-methyl-5-hydroxy-6-metoxy-1,4-benzoquinol methylase